MGNLIGCGAAALVQTFVPANDLATWGWRLPFLCSVPIGLLGLWLRRDVSESPQFQQIAAESEIARAPLLEALRENKSNIFITAGLTLMLSVGFYLPWVWLPTWLSRILPHAIPLEEALLLNTVAMAALLLLQPSVWRRFRLVRPAASDPRGQPRAGGAQLPAFSIDDARGRIDRYLRLADHCGLHINGDRHPRPAAYAELFPTRTRYSGIALGYNCTQALLGGTTPFIATWLIDTTGDVCAPAFYFLAAALLCALAGLRNDRTGRPGNCDLGALALPTAALARCTTSCCTPSNVSESVIWPCDIILSTSASGTQRTRSSSVPSGELAPD